MNEVGLGISRLIASLMDYAAEIESIWTFRIYANGFVYSAMARKYFPVLQTMRRSKGSRRKPAVYNHCIVQQAPCHVKFPLFTKGMA